jgi:lantibiotic modifying enzyme
MDDSFPRRMPNFSHGTAGVAALLARLSPRSGSKTLENSQLGAEHLIAIADRSNGGFQVGHDTPDNPQLVYMGWCHGPCGTARLFRELFVATKDDRWRELELACAKSVMSSGLPEQRLAGFWNNVGRCCGDAGVIEFMLDLYDETHDAQYLDFARRVGRDVIARATRDEHGMRWIQAENRAQPDVLVAQTGLMQGAAGIGLALVHLDEIERGIERSVRLPDEPTR